MIGRTLGLGVALGLGCLAEPAAAEPAAAAPAAAAPASDTRRLNWRYRRPGGWEYAATASVAVAAIYVEFATEQPLEPKWSSTLAYEPPVRDALKLDSASAREQASRLSDYLGLATQAWAYLDASLVPLLSDGGNLDVAWQMTFINLQASAFTALSTRGIDRLVARERPDVDPCLEDPNYHEMCFKGPASSFPSGHTSGAFTGAGLVCAHHLYLPLYGHRAADLAACGVSGALAISVGMLRMHADRHYVTDVVAGAAIGTLTGFAVPVLGHYWFVEVSHGPGVASRWTAVPQVSASHGGVSVLGSL
ncbi:MAG TPA: phosphatase PAP2 family protein [Polyangiaceae bacterium]